MNVLITGGTGFVGSHLIDVLLERGDTVTALVRSPAKAKGLEPRGVRLVLGDLHDLPALETATASQDVVYHVAGLVTARNPAEFDRANREGSGNLVRAATTHGSPRFILVSSMAAAGPSAPGRPLTGQEPPQPVTHYGRSKLAGEEEVRRSSLPWTILRPPMVYGGRRRRGAPQFTPLDHSPATDGVRPARQRSPQGVQAGALGSGSGVRVGSPGTLRGDRG